MLDHMNPRRAQILVLFLFFMACQAFRLASPRWSINGRQVQQNGKDFVFQGLNYSPIPIGASNGDPLANRGDMFTNEFSFIWNRDLPLIRETGANSLRLYTVYPWAYPSPSQTQWTTATNLDHTSFLDACWNGGVNPIYVWLGYNMETSFHVATGSSPPNGVTNWRLANGEYAWMDPNYANSDSVAQTYARNAFVSLATLYGSHPAVVGIVVSNEQNSEMVIGSSAFWQFFDQTAALVKKAAPTTLTTMTLVDDGLLSIQYAESFGLPHIDIWGINSYRGTEWTGFDTLFSDYKTYSSKPLIVGEYGCPASTRNIDGSLALLPNNSVAQANYIVTHWNDIKLNSNVTCGGFLFEWQDEWWKSGNATVQTPSNAPNPAYPGGWGDEAFFGLNGVEMSSPSASPTDYLTRGPDVLIPREALFAVAQMFGGQVTPSNLAPFSPELLLPFSFPPSASPVVIPQTLVPSDAPSPSSTHPASPLDGSTTPNQHSAPTSCSSRLYMSSFVMVSVFLLLIDHVIQYFVDPRSNCACN